MALIGYLKEPATRDTLCGRYHTNAPWISSKLDLKITVIQDEILIAVTNITRGTPP